MDSKYYLAIETKPKNYFPINLSNLNLANNRSTTELEKIDAFTLQYTKSEIFEAIKEANLLDINDSMSLIVIYNEKNMIRKINALTKDISFDMWADIKLNYNNN